MSNPHLNIFAAASSLPPPPLHLLLTPEKWVRVWLQYRVPQYSRGIVLKYLLLNYSLFQGKIQRRCSSAVVPCPWAMHCMHSELSELTIMLVQFLLGAPHVLWAIWTQWLISTALVLKQLWKLQSMLRSALSLPPYASLPTKIQMQGKGRDEQQWCLAPACTEPWSCALPSPILSYSLRTH